MSNANTNYEKNYGQIFSQGETYDDLPSDVEPTETNYAGIRPDLEEPSENPDMGLTTDITKVTSMDEDYSNIIEEMSGVQGILNDKLNLIINSHRIIIDRLDTIESELRKINDE